MKIKEKTRNYWKRHRKDILEDLFVGAIVGTGAYMIYKYADSKVLKLCRGNVIANKEMDTIDILTKSSNGKRQLWVFDVENAKCLYNELDGAINTLRPQG